MARNVIAESYGLRPQLLSAGRSTGGSPWSPGPGGVSARPSPSGWPARVRRWSSTTSTRSRPRPRASRSPTTAGRRRRSSGDVRRRRRATALVEAAAETYGGLDILVNNAGITRDGMVHRMTDDSGRPGRRRQPDAGRSISAGPPCPLLRRPAAARPTNRKVVNIASINGIYGVAGNANYSAAKAGSSGSPRRWPGSGVASTSTSTPSRPATSPAPGSPRRGATATSPASRPDDDRAHRGPDPDRPARRPRTTSPACIAFLVVARHRLRHRPGHRGARRPRDHHRGVKPRESHESTRSSRSRRRSACVEDGDVVALQNMATQAAPMAAGARAHPPGDARPRPGRARRRHRRRLAGGGRRASTA